MPALPAGPRRRTFLNAPPSVRSFVAALLEPCIAVLVYVAAAEWFDTSLARADVLLCLLAFVLRFPGRNHFDELPLAAAGTIASSWLGFAVVLAAIGWVSRSLEMFDAAVLLAWLLATPVLQWTAFLLVRQALLAAARQTSSRRRVVIVGAGALGAKVATALQASHGGVSMHVLGYCDDRGADRLDAQASTMRLGELNSLSRIVREQVVHDVYITLPLGSQPRIGSLLEQLQGTTASIYFVPDVFGVSIIQGRLQELSGLPVVGLCVTPFTGMNRLVKRVFDVALSSLILLLIAPLLLVVAAGVKLSSPGPVIFRQLRNGLDGSEIVVYKFRSMHQHALDASVAQATRQDPRITRFGAFLRRTSLDEMPQFINVLQGRMSIVGPRPHAVAHNQQYRELIKAYMVRHKVKPGITGWAQVNGCRGETETVDKMRRRVEHDLAYLRNWSLALDLHIVLRTVWLVFFDRHAY